MGDEQKRATVAGNAKQIVGLKAQLDSIQNLLQTLVVEKTSLEETAGGLDEMNSTARVDKQTPRVDMQTPRRGTPAQDVFGSSHLRGQRTVGFSADLEEEGDAWRIIRGRKTPPTHVRELTDDEAIQKRVSQLLAANWNPLETRDTGKRSFAHTHIVRGTRKVKTGLGELSLPEYIFGLSQVAKTHEGQVREAIIRHIEAIAEDAITYTWSDVRAWSEEICSRIHDKKLSWGEETKIEYLRLKLSQVVRPRGSEVETDGQGQALSAELTAAKPGPPCRQFNFGTCYSVDDHVQNGYRHLHICSYCIFSKCTFNRHAEKDCMGKKLKNERRRNFSSQGNEVRSGGYQ